MKTKLLIYSVGVAFSIINATWAQSPSPAINAGPVTVFSNVRIFDGKSDKLSAPTNVLVRGNVIEKISDKPIPTDRRADTVLIDGGGHTMLVRPTVAQLLNGDIGHLNLVAGAEANDTLMRGFTTVRDVGGPSFGLKQAIDEGTTIGPRIFPSGAI